MANDQTHSPGCTFCDLIRGAGEVSICHEDSEAIAFMDIQPVNAGHVLVVPRRHYESLFDVPHELGVHLFEVTMRVASAVRRVSGCEGMNIIVNSGAAAGQDEPHYHVHLIPRKRDDGFDVPLPFAGSEMPDRTLLDAMAARIGAALHDPMRTERRRRGGAGSGGAEGPESGAPRDAVAPPVDRESAGWILAGTDRGVALPVFADRGAAPAGAPDDDLLIEGAHGELVRELDPRSE